MVFQFYIYNNHSILLSVYIYMIPSKRKIYNIYSENSVNYFLDKGSILFKKRVFISRWKY